MEPCAEGEDPKAITFVGCKKAEIESLRTKMPQLISYVKTKYGDPPSADAESCQGIFVIEKCLEFVPRELVANQSQRHDPRTGSAQSLQEPAR